VAKKKTSQTEDFRWEARTTTRIGLASTLVGGAIGILFAGFQVQGWRVPKLLALVLFAVLGLVIVGAVLAVVYEIVRAVRRFLEHRATTASWVSAEAPGFLDFEPDGMRAMDRFTREMNKLSGDTKDLGEKADSHTKRMERSMQSSGKRKQRLANRAAKDIDRSAVYIEKRAALLSALVHDIFRNFQGFVEMTTPSSEEEFRVAEELRSVVDETRKVTVQSIESTEGYRDSVRVLEKQNPTRNVRIAAKRLAEALSDVVVILGQYEKRSSALASDLDRKLDGR
jgi:hypothetical protein